METEPGHQDRFTALAATQEETAHAPPAALDAQLPPLLAPPAWRRSRRRRRRRRPPLSRCRSLPLHRALHLHTQSTQQTMANFIIY
jgi:hypothetical protein